MCDDGPGGSYCDQHHQAAFTVLVIAGAVIFVALVISMCIRIGVKRTFAMLTIGLRPRRQHHRDEDPDAAAVFKEEAGIPDRPAKAPDPTKPGTCERARTGDTRSRYGARDSPRR